MKFGPSPVYGFFLEVKHGLEMDCSNFVNFWGMAYCDEVGVDVVLGRVHWEDSVIDLDQGMNDYKVNKKSKNFEIFLKN